MYSEDDFTNMSMGYVAIPLNAKDKDLQVHAMASAAMMVMTKTYGEAYARKYLDDMIITKPEGF